MKYFNFKLLCFLFCLTLTIACKKEESKEVVKDSVKLYIIASPGAYSTNSPVSLQLSGTNIATQNDIKNVYILEANYPKGETQTVSLKAISGDPLMNLEVSKSVSLKEADRVEYKTGNGTISVTFTP